MFKHRLSRTTLLLREGKKGFTLVELLIVIMIIGVLATIAISFMLSFRERAYISMIKSDLSSAYKASLDYHTDNPDGTVTLDLLKEHGHRESEQVALDIVDGGADSLEIHATHPSVSGVYQVDHEGRISEQ